MSKPQPNSNPLAGKGILKVGCHRLGQARANICPVNRGHQRSNQNSSGRDDVVHVVLVVAIVGAAIDVGRRKLRVDVVPMPWLIERVTLSELNSLHT